MSQPWSDEQIFIDEPIHRAAPLSDPSLPAPLAAARAMEHTDKWEPRPALFYRQGQLLADYEDDFPYSGDPVRYYPTYQSLTNAELRGYFSWRSKVRAAAFPPAPLSFVYLYIYEIINSIGFDSPQAGYERLLELNRCYSYDDPWYHGNMRNWIRDYIIYYDLDANLLPESRYPAQAGCIAVFDHIGREKSDKIIDAIKQLTMRWLSRSRFYAVHFADMNQVIVNVLRKMAIHYETRCKRNLTEQIFGLRGPRHIHMFSSAIFANPLKRMNYEFATDAQTIYKCEDGIWSVIQQGVTARALRKLNDLLKTIDCLMREAYNFGSPIKTEVSTRWIHNLIREEIAKILALKTQNTQPRIDLSLLDKIRQDAEDVQVRLIVEEEEDRDDEVSEPPVTVESQPSLTPQEQKLLHCLLYDGNLDWIRREGLILSVLADSINDKLYDIFEDTVMDDSPRLVEDYIDDLKEIVAP